MTVIIGLACAALGVTAFIFSLPRGGRLARFVGTEWEAYVVVMMIALFVTGIVMAIAGIAELAE